MKEINLVSKDKIKVKRSNKHRQFSTSHETSYSYIQYP